MALDIRRDVNGHRLITLVECPACGEDLEDKSPQHHIRTEHTPEDFGLSPIGERTDTGPLRFDHPLIEG